MAESKMVIGGSPTAGVHRGLGILRLLRGWPTDQVAASSRPQPWPDHDVQPVPPQAAPAPAGPRLVAIDRRATTLALRQTIDEWRTAQRELEGLVVGSRDRARTQAKVELLRTRHRRLFIQLTRAER